jgi:hypothetical protein
MRNAVVQLPDKRSSGERRQVLRAAIRQLERADVYLAAVAAMGIDDREASHALLRVRGQVDDLRRYLVDVRAET